MSKEDKELDPESLQFLGLTKREAQVLLWTSHGKRNNEIAQILGVSSRTIGKHLEKIFVKLCVETRTAAANMALEVLHPSWWGNGSSRLSHPYVSSVPARRTHPVDGASCHLGKVEPGSNQKSW
jgi:DNA-binding CsgD family transcriptional regulator